MEIRIYDKELDETNIMQLLRNEGEEWSCYWADKVSEKYKIALENSITYVAYTEDSLCGYSRSIDDFGFYVYVCDLLVAPKHRGNNIGRKLMECIYEDHFDKTVFVMSDVDGYYEKQGFKREGSIFQVTKRS